MFHAITYAEEFAIQKRALDVALKGYSDVKQPKRKAGSITVRTSSFKSNVKSGLQLISKTREEQNHILERLDESIHTEVKHIKSLLAEYSGSNVEILESNSGIPDAKKSEVCSAMRSMKLHQKEYVRILRVLEGIKVIEIGMQDGFLDPRKVVKCLNEIQKVIWKARAHSQSQKVMASDDKLLDQLKHEEFYPYLKSKHHPGKVFFRSTKPKTPAEIQQEHLLAKSRRSSATSADTSVSKPLSSYTTDDDGSSMPALSSICSESVVTASVFGDSQYSYAASEISSSAPNSPTLGSNRNKHFLTSFLKQQDLIHPDDIDRRDILIPALALQQRHPETIVLDVLSPSLDNLVRKERPSRWDGDCNTKRSSSEKSGSPDQQQPQQQQRLTVATTTAGVDAASTHPRAPPRPAKVDCLPTIARRSDSFIDCCSCLEEEGEGEDAVRLSSIGSSSVDSIPQLPPRRGSADSTTMQHLVRVLYRRD